MVFRKIRQAIRHSFLLLFKQALLEPAKVVYELLFALRKPLTLKDQEVRVLVKWDLVPGRSLGRELEERSRLHDAPSTATAKNPPPAYSINQALGAVRMLLDIHAARHVDEMCLTAVSENQRPDPSLESLDSRGLLFVRDVFDDLDARSEVNAFGLVLGHAFDLDTFVRAPTTDLAREEAGCSDLLESTQLGREGTWNSCPKPAD
jgi:hypothetical protein